MNGIQAVFPDFLPFGTAEKAFTKPTVLLNARHRLLDILHNIPWLAVEDFTQLDNGINGHATVIHQTVNSFGVNLVSIAKVNFFDTLLFLFKKNFLI